MTKFCPEEAWIISYLFNFSYKCFHTVFSYKFQKALPLYVPLLMAHFCQVNLYRIALLKSGIMVHLCHMELKRVAALGGSLSQKCHVQHCKDCAICFCASGLWSLTSKQKRTTPLYITAQRGHTECLKHLLGHGADVNAEPGGATALHAACANGHTECAKLLLRIGADPNAISDEGYAPLHMCTSPQTIL